MPSGIYLHIPFCRRACVYCDFHFSVSQKNKKELLSALEKEIEIRADYLTDKNISSIYFGGGTPSLLTAEEISSLINKIRTNFKVQPEVEITLEGNPEDLKKDYLNQLRETEVNRLSIGIQSFDAQELKWMNRLHSAEESEQVIELAKSFGFNNISIDLIYGSKFQNPHSWEKTLEKAFSLNIQHLSPYNLTIEEKTTLGRKLKKGEEQKIDDTKSAVLFEILQKKAKEYGFIHYEISNFGKPGFFSKHNSSYWKGQHYLGIGPSAHSFNGYSRQWNISNNNRYISGIESRENVSENEILKEDEIYNEFILTRLRTIWGIQKQELEEKFEESFQNHFFRGIEKYILNEDVDFKNENYTLSDKGKLIADKITSDLFI